MKNGWKTVRTGLMLFALPLVATAAASAHSWIVDSSPISVDSNVAVVETSAIGNSRVHTVALNRNGAVEGRIASIDAQTKNTSGLAGLKVYFIQGGEVVKESVTGANGSFLVPGMAEGAYSFVAAGQTGFAAYGVRVVSDESGSFENVMEAAAVSPRLDVVRRILSDELPAVVADEIIELSGVSEETQLVGSNRVLMEGDVLYGRVVALDNQSKTVNETKVHILQNGKQVAQVVADESGEFSIEGLEPGVYDFVAAGQSGFAAVSFEAVASDQITQAGGSEEIPVSIESGSTAALPATLEVRLTAIQDGAAVSGQLDAGGSSLDSGIGYDVMPIEYASDSIAYGGASGGGGGGAYYGGGGGGGGGGGLSRIAIWGALGVGIAALASNNNDNPPPASNENP